jgi:hypothetical protein
VCESVRERERKSGKVARQTSQPGRWEGKRIVGGLGKTAAAGQVLGLSPSRRSSRPQGKGEGGILATGSRMRAYSVECVYYYNHFYCYYYGIPQVLYSTKYLRFTVRARTLL